MLFLRAFAVAAPTPPPAELVVEVPADADQAQMKNIAQAAADAAALAASAELGVPVVAAATAELVNEPASTGAQGSAFSLSLGASINQSIKTQDQQCQWPNKPRPQTQGS